MILWTFGLVVIIGIISALFILQPPAGFRESMGKSQKNRTPASLEVAGPNLVAPSSQPAVGALTADMQLTCKDDRIVLKGYVRQIRLLGTFCNKPANAELLGAELKSQNNGVAATLFVMSPQQFTTDYMTLIDGENRFTLTADFRDKAGNKTVENRVLTIIRRPENSSVQ